MKFKIKSKAGFSLMEMLIATSIFVIVSMASLAIYSATVRAGRQTTALTRVQQDTQLIMQVLAKKIRGSAVNYEYANYAPAVVNPEEELALIDEFGDEYVFKKSGSSLSVSINGGLEKTINAEAVLIDDLKFFINPVTDPFGSLSDPPISQPYVTISLTISSSKGGENASLTVQETVPQRAGGTD
ncbi:MAG TPA: prepilin-type N-terminal cleavage/methylation domain-containing protein [bacterium]|nr:prepilin-type N-terminal cleavage/methylation domain-containing protein [bacterium]HPL95689.1 prepilin-type N-terminal cleavage/methylation domain-containing protein [bacterium]